MQVGSAAHERHGLGVGVVGRGAQQRASLYMPWPRRRSLLSAHQRLSSLGAAPASRACAAVIIPYPSAAMSYMSSKCAMSKS